MKLKKVINTIAWERYPERMCPSLSKPNVLIDGNRKKREYFKSNVLFFLNRYELKQSRISFIKITIFLVAQAIFAYLYLNC